jgi:hypothetical protein
MRRFYRLCSSIHLSASPFVSKQEPAPFGGTSSTQHDPNAAAPAALALALALAPAVLCYPRLPGPAFTLQLTSNRTSGVLPLRSFSMQVFFEHFVFFLSCIISRSICAFAVILDSQCMLRIGSLGGDIRILTCRIHTRCELHCIWESSIAAFTGLQLPLRHAMAPARPHDLRCRRSSKATPTPRS